MTTEKKARKARTPKACDCPRCTKVSKNAKLLAKVKRLTCEKIKK